MLTCENPNHPEYLAMLHCVEDRRKEKIRLSGLELQFKMSVLKNRAIAERAQIMSQFYQAIRESREKVLEELGQEWYEIQQERRRYANTIPDYGIRFPTTKAQTVKQAVAYNKEVSILSGFAKHVGFPAAPAIHGASEEQLENDLEAIAVSNTTNRLPSRTAIANSSQRSREALSRPAASYPPNYHQEFAGELPFGRMLGPAGEQFIEQTPWANPNHPAHQQRQNAHQDGGIQEPVASTSSGPWRHSHQPGGMFSSSTTTIMNGESPAQMQKARSSAGHEVIKPPKIGAEQVAKRDTIAQAS